jgi:hypothetical protein
MVGRRTLPPAPPPLGHVDAERVPELQRKLDSMRPDSPVPPEPLADEDVTGVIVLAVERVAVAQRETSDAVRAATSRLLHETECTRALTRALSRRPPSG